MVEAFAECAACLDELAGLEIAAIVVLGDSPLAHSLQRRKREVDRPEDVIAGHDSLI